MSLRPRLAKSRAPANLHGLGQGWLGVEPGLVELLGTCSVNVEILAHSEASKW